MAWATAYYYKSYQEKREHKWQYNYQHLFSPSYIFNQYSTPGDETQGMGLKDALDTVATQGAAPLAAFFYNQDDWTFQPSAYVREAAAAYKGGAYRQIYGRGGFGVLDDLKAHLATRDPFVMTIPLYTGVQFDGWDIRIIGYVPPVIDVPSASLFVVKRYDHALAIVGYDDTKKRFKFINSWGPTWGHNGYGYLTYGFVLEDLPWEADVMTDLLGDPTPPTNCTSTPSKPVLVAPAQKEIVLDRQVFLDLYAARCAATFQVTVKLGSPTGPTIDSNNSLAMSQYTTHPLLPGKTYYWRARACNSKGCGAWTIWSQFTLSPKAN